MEEPAPEAHVLGREVPGAFRGVDVDLLDFVGGRRRGQGSGSAAAAVGVGLGGGEGRKGSRAGGEEGEVEGGGARREMGER